MRMLFIHAMQGSVQFALHGAEKYRDIAARRCSDAELMSENAPLVP